MASTATTKIAPRGSFWVWVDVVGKISRREESRLDFGNEFWRASYNEGYTPREALEKWKEIGENRSEPEDLGLVGGIQKAHGRSVE